MRESETKKVPVRAECGPYAEDLEQQRARARMVHQGLEALRRIRAQREGLQEILAHSSRAVLS